MLGVVPSALIGGKGAVWMLGTEEVYRQGRSLMTLAPPLFDEWLQMFPRLENIIMADNTRALRVLRRWGFEIDDQPLTYGGQTFLKFWKDRAIQAPAINQ